MKKTEATARFNRLYDLIYDNALAYAVESTGNPETAEDILADTYSALYRRLLNSREFDIENIRNYFFTCLKNSVKKYYVKRVDSELLYEDIAAADGSDCQPFIDLLLNTEINITEKQAADSLLIKKINKYIIQKGEIQSKAFILRFYYGYPLEKISELLNVPRTTLNNYIYRLLDEIRKNFLDEYIAK